MIGLGVKAPGVIGGVVGGPCWMIGVGVKAPGVIR